MAAIPKRRKFTVDEYHRMGKAGILSRDDRVELIEGEIVEMPPIGVPHASHVGRISHLFSQAFFGRALVWVQNPLRLGARSEPVPDIMLLRPRDDFYAERHPIAADVLLIVEVSDTTLAYDQRTKLPLYAAHQIPETWIADLNHQLVQVHRQPGASGYANADSLGRDQTLSVLAFPKVTFSRSEERRVGKECSTWWRP